MSAADSPQPTDDPVRKDAGTGPDSDPNDVSWPSVTRQYAHYATVGIMFPVAVALGFYLGYLLDRRLGTVPLFAMLGLALGVAAAIRNLLQTVKSDTNE